MSLKYTGVSREELRHIAREHQFDPAFAEQSCYIASGPDHEILAVLRANGLFDLQILKKSQTAVSVNKTIRAFRKFVTLKKANA